MVRVPLDLGHHLCRKQEFNGVASHVGDLDVLHEDEVDWLSDFVRGLGQEGNMVADGKAGGHSFDRNRREPQLAVDLRAGDVGRNQMTGGHGHCGDLADDA